MRYQIEIKGTSPIITHNAEPHFDTFSELNLEKKSITGKKGSNRTQADELRLRQIECCQALYFNQDGAPTIPGAAFRACLEKAARKLKQGPAVREGLVVTGDADFVYDKERYGTTVEDLSSKTQFTVLVKVQKARLLRTRAKFDDWSATFSIDTDPELVDKHKLQEWLDIAGRRIGLCDWRPECSGMYGRFETVGIKEDTR